MWLLFDVKQHAIRWTDDTHDLLYNMAALGHNELNA